MTHRSNHSTNPTMHYAKTEERPTCTCGKKMIVVEDYGIRYSKRWECPDNWNCQNSADNYQADLV